MISRGKKADHSRLSLRGWALETVVSGGRLHLSTHDGEYPAILAVLQPGPVPSRSARLVYGF
jgi:hypothetical protein